MIRFILVFILSFTLAFAQEDKESFFDRLTRYHEVIRALVQGSLDSRGLSFDTLFKPNLPSYDQVFKSINSELYGANCASLRCENYEEDFANKVNSHLASAQEFRVLPNVESFDLRKELIREAKKSIYVLVWAISDDETGREFQKIILDAHAKNPKIEIKLIVDGNIANLMGRKVLKAIEARSLGKIKVMRWKSRKYRANGTHRKLLIVDEEHVIVGGMNIGNNYSHMDSKKKWRDLDIYIRGRQSGASAALQFEEIWNRQLTEFPKLVSQLGVMTLSVPEAEEIDGHPVVFVDQFPGSAVDKAYHNIHTAVVKLFRDATETIDIENAYFIMDPIIRKELERTIKRGVKVRLFTNSEKTIDEPVVSTPVVHSAMNVLKMGGKVYLRQGTTLHSKYMVVDGKISMVGSFNFHPRSLRFDAENVAVVFDKNLAKDLTEQFEAGLLEAREYKDPAEFKINWTLLSFLLNSFYFDFL